MRRESDLDRAYSLLVLLCEDATPPDPQARYALMTAFNLVADQHTPGSLLLTDRGTDPAELLTEAAALITSVFKTATDLDEALSLRTAAALLTSVVEAGGRR